MKTLKLSRDQAEKVAEVFLFGELELESLKRTARIEGVASRLLPSGAKFVVSKEKFVVSKGSKEIPAGVILVYRLSGYAYDGSDIKAVLDKIK